jgi:hypothetical protein
LAAIHGAGGARDPEGIQGAPVETAPKMTALGRVNQKYDTDIAPSYEVAGAAPLPGTPEETQATMDKTNNVQRVSVSPGTQQAITDMDVKAAGDYNKAKEQYIESLANHFGSTAQGLRTLNPGKSDADLVEALTHDMKPADLSNLAKEFGNAPVLGGFVTKVLPNIPVLSGAGSAAINVVVLAWSTTMDTLKTPAGAVALSLDQAMHIGLTDAAANRIAESAKAQGLAYDDPRMIVQYGKLTTELIFDAIGTVALSPNAPTEQRALGAALMLAKFIPELKVGLGPAGKVFSLVMQDAKVAGLMSRGAQSLLSGNVNRAILSVRAAAINVMKPTEEAFAMSPSMNLERMLAQGGSFTKMPERAASDIVNAAEGVIPETSPALVASDLAAARAARDTLGGNPVRAAIGMRAGQIIERTNEAAQAQIKAARASAGGFMKGDIGGGPLPGEKPGMKYGTPKEVASVAKKDALKALAQGGSQANNKFLTENALAKGATQAEVDVALARAAARDARGVKGGLKHWGEDANAEKLTEQIKVESGGKLTSIQKFDEAIRTGENLEGVSAELMAKGRAARASADAETALKSAKAAEAAKVVAQEAKTGEIDPFTGKPIGISAESVRGAGPVKGGRTVEEVTLSRRDPLSANTAEEIKAILAAGGKPPIPSTATNMVEPSARKVANFLADALGFTSNLEKTAATFGAPTHAMLRHTQALMLAHPQAWMNDVKGWKYVVSKGDPVEIADKATAIMKDYWSQKGYGDHAFFRVPHGGPEAVGKGQEELASTIISRVPGLSQVFDRSSVGFVMGINHTMDAVLMSVEHLYANESKVMGRGPSIGALTNNDRAAMGDLMAIATGHGFSVGKGHETATIVNKMLGIGLFSPQLEVARIRLITKSIDGFAGIVKSVATGKAINPVDLEAAKLGASFLISKAGIFTVARMGGLPVDLNPLSGTFGKVDIGTPETAKSVIGILGSQTGVGVETINGHIWIDMTGGEASLLRVASRLFQSAKDAFSGEDYLRKATHSQREKNWVELIGDAIKTNTSPPVYQFWNAMQGVPIEVPGIPMTVSSAMKAAGVKIPSFKTKDVIRSGRNILQGVTGAPSGGGVNSPSASGF